MFILMLRFIAGLQLEIKFLLYSRHHAEVEAWNQWRDPSPRLSAWATQLRRDIAAVASHWRHCADMTGSEIEREAKK